MSSLAPVVAADVEMETREASPAHFLVKIDPFSLLHKRGIDKLETTEFKSGAYKWRLVIYPNGHGTGKEGEGYVSVYLAMADKASLPSNWEVNATFSVCLFNHISDNYCCSLGRARRFSELNPERGFMKFMSKKTLTDPSNGYVVDDKCIFGAEVYVNENKAITQCLSVKNVYPEPYKQEFMISNFSTLKVKWISDEFTVGGHKWIIDVHYNGSGKETGRSLSIFLRNNVVSNNCASSERVRPCYTIRLKNQLHDRGHRQMTISDRWFSASKSEDWGW
ncbi:hypothetical protein CASFOL_001129 [Castilleja foliolosa]|uniref:MATH domain-containing protein n=1 Tax=Castilleja foliolosa TaxID=1961234 RepID=A0ABD3ELN3_9LAMI